MICNVLFVKKLLKYFSLFVAKISLTRGEQKVKSPAFFGSAKSSDKV